MELGLASFHSPAPGVAIGKADRGAATTESRMRRSPACAMGAQRRARDSVSPLGEQAEFLLALIDEQP
jgi:hypothetical protein